MLPTIKSGQDGDSLKYTEVFSETFDVDGPFQQNSNFRRETLEGDNAGNYTAGSNGQDGDGNLDPNAVIPGARWAAYYNGHFDKTMNVSGGSLSMGGYRDITPNPTKASFTDSDGVFVEPDKHKLYCGMLDTFARVGNGTNLIVDSSAPNKTFGPGHYHEAKFDFSGMKAAGFRISYWLFPATDNAGNVHIFDDAQNKYVDAAPAYDGVPASGCEVDIFEIDHSVASNGTDFRNTMLMKVIADGDGTLNTPNSFVDLSSFGILTGWHTLGLLHMPDRLVWYCDGVEVQRDEASVPQVPMYIIISREMNSGVHTTPPLDDPKVPEDYGLYATNVHADADKVDTDVVLVDYVKVWAVGDPEFKLEMASVTSPAGKSVDVVPVKVTNRDGTVVTDKSVDIDVSGIKSVAAEVIPRNSPVAEIHLSGEPDADEHATVVARIDEGPIVSILGPETLVGDRVTLSWTAGDQVVTSWAFWLGSMRELGDYLNTGFVTSATTSAENTNPLPTDGSEVHGTLQYFLEGETEHRTCRMTYISE